MPAISTFDVFKIGVGPSSSHTMGPWLAAQEFMRSMKPEERRQISRIRVQLFGSLAKTGKGHSTDVAIQLGLLGLDPKTIDVSTIGALIRRIAAEKRIELCGQHPIDFESASDIAFHRDQSLPFHPNGMRLIATLSDGSQRSAEFFSVGGGEIVRDGVLRKADRVKLPCPIDSATDLLAFCESMDCPISDVVMRNERAWQPEAVIRSKLTEIRDAMYASIHRGCRTPGVLPGGLNVQRRAAAMAENLLGHPCPSDLSSWLDAVKSRPAEFRRVLDWVSCFALAVNEENAALGRVVTAPTNGSAGVIPAVLLYLDLFCEAPADAFVSFLLTAGEIGCLFKKGATISAALGGCQAEIGVSSAMAAAALAESLGGTPGQAAEAAEMAMEHHLGMTCDPIGGLVQIPCIERNAMGAIKAITAAQLSLQRDPAGAKVSLDAIIRTMWETAQDMHAKYKETSEGGLAIQVPVNVIEC
jgi:L-serine dehydratase